MLPRKTLLSVTLFAVLMFALRQVPGMDWLRPPDGGTLAAILHPPEPPAATPAAAPPTEPAKPVQTAKTVRDTSRPDVVSAPGRPRITDPVGAMDSFYRALRALEAGQAARNVRILHYGDSPTTADSITGDVRRLLQTRYGDGGHGFLLTGQPWAWYGHHGVSLKARGWTIQRASEVDRSRDALHGLGGVTFSGYPGAFSEAKLPGGHRHVDIHFLNQPGGGTFQVKAGDTAVLEQATAGESKSPGFVQGVLPPGSDTVRITVTQGRVRLLGWTFEKDAPGLVYSSIGLNGASVQTLVNYFEESHWAAQLRHQEPALVVLNYGSNESVNAAYVDKYYAQELRKLIRRVQYAVPQASILIMSPMDRGERNQRGEIVTVPTVPRIVEIQQQTALELGCAFFSTFAAMGGPGTMAQWYAAKPKLVAADFLHPTPGGAAKIGAMLDEAIRESYGRWKAKQ
ncbi:MAG: hypothetical protein FJW39_12635 [Acidobacteria bacterium]|nr:hypothetical protein [Acidobacteriota bacterium]